MLQIGNESPEGAVHLEAVSFADWIAPSGLDDLLVFVPGALPQAGMECPCGADSGQRTADSGQQTADSRQQTADSRWQTADGGWWMVDGGWWMAAVGADQEFPF